MLIKIRSDRHWTQYDLADELQTSRGSICNWERGKVQPPVYLMSKIRALAGLK